MDLDNSNENFNRIRKKMINKKNAAKVAKNKYRETIVYEKDYLLDENLEIQIDVYSVFIAANMSKNCSKEQI